MNEEQINPECPIDELSINRCIEQQFANRDPNVHNIIEPIHSQIHFYYNSINIAIGKQGCGKTSFLCKQLIMLSQVPNQPYSAILYVGKGDVDYTFMKLKQFFRIPVFMCTYDKFLAMFQQYCKEREQDNSHVFIIFEDASFVFQKENQEWNNIICRLRHLRCTVWMNIHVWKSVSTTFKSQLTTAFIFKGFSREQMMWMYRQMSVAISFPNLWGGYSMMTGRQCLKIDNIDSKCQVIH